MKFVSAQPATQYFVWQHEVFDYQFQKLGYDINDSIVVFVKTDPLSETVIKYVNKNKHRVILVEDERKDKFYIPSIKIHGLYQLYKHHYHLIDGHNVFLHDSDIVFTKHFDWDSIVKIPNTAYASDCISYIGAKYIDSKSPILTDKMCEIVDISPALVRAKERQAGSAQTIFPKNSIDYKFFEKCEKDANRLYQFGSSEEGKSYKKANDPYPIQIWCAEMWSILWNLWLKGIACVVHKDMEFGWPNWNLKELDKVKILHLSGITSDKDGQFYKGKYINKLPFGEDFSNINKDKAYGYYASIVQELAHLKDFYK
jgi:hypothetical protein